jgi:hypothetical protein
MKNKNVNNHPEKKNAYRTALLLSHQFDKAIEFYTNELKTAGGEENGTALFFIGISHL